MSRSMRPMRLWALFAALLFAPVSSAVAQQAAGNLTPAEAGRRFDQVMMARDWGNGVKARVEPTGIPCWRAFILGPGRPDSWTATTYTESITIDLRPGLVTPVLVGLQVALRGPEGELTTTFDRETEARAFFDALSVLIQSCKPVAPARPASSSPAATPAAYPYAANMEGKGFYSLYETKTQAVVFGIGVGQYRQAWKPGEGVRSIAYYEMPHEGRLPSGDIVAYDYNGLEVDCGQRRAQLFSAYRYYLVGPTGSLPFNGAWTSIDEAGPRAAVARRVCAGMPEAAPFASLPAYAPQYRARPVSSLPDAPPASVLAGAAPAPTTTAAPAARPAPAQPSHPPAAAAAPAAPAVFPQVPSLAGFGFRPLYEIRSHAQVLGYPAGSYVQPWKFGDADRIVSFFEVPHGREALSGRIQAFAVVRVAISCGARQMHQLDSARYYETGPSTPSPITPGASSIDEASPSAGAAQRVCAGIPAAAPYTSLETFAAQYRAKPVGALPETPPPSASAGPGR